jgi:hypothetical protein
LLYKEKRLNLLIILEAVIPRWSDPRCLAANEDLMVVLMRTQATYGKSESQRIIYKGWIVA